MTGQCWFRVIAASIMLLLSSPRPAGGEPLDGLIVAAGPVSLSQADPAWKGSISVTNPTTRDITAAPAPRGNGPSQNRCEVAVAKGGTVKAGTSGSLAVSVATTDDCKNPADGAHQLVLFARSEPGATTSQVIFVPIAMATENAADPKTTGLKLPTETVFLRRSGDNLVGSLDLINTTSLAVIVTPSTVREDCSVSPAVPPGKGTPVEPGGSTSITVRVPGACHKLDSEALALSVLTSTADGARYEYGTIKIEAEVDWPSVLRAAKWILIAALVATVTGCSFAVWAYNRATPSPTRKLTWSDPIVASAETPRSWLTAIATVGPVATALFSTTNLLKGVTGVDSSAPKTLVLVATAVALALVAFATMITNIPAVTVAVDGKKQDCPRIWQFVLAAGLTACSAGLALVGVWVASVKLDLPGGDEWVHVVGIALTLALLGYAFWSVKRFIERFGQLSPDAQAPAQPKPIPPELLAGALRSLAPNFIGLERLTAIHRLDQRRWLAASQSAASEMLDLLEALNAKQAAATAKAAATTAAQVAQSVSTTEGVPAAAGKTATDAAAVAQVTAAAAQAAANAGDDEQACALAELASHQAIEAITAASQAAQDITNEEVLSDLVESEILVGKLGRLTTSPGDDHLPSPRQTSDRRPLTRFMI